MSSDPSVNHLFFVHVTEAKKCWNKNQFDSPAIVLVFYFALFSFFPCPTSSSRSFEQKKTGWSFNPSQSNLNERKGGGVSLIIAIFMSFRKEPTEQSYFLIELVLSEVFIPEGSNLEHVYELFFMPLKFKSHKHICLKLWRRQFHLND